MISTIASHVLRSIHRFQDASVKLHSASPSDSATASESVIRDGAAAQFAAALLREQERVRQHPNPATPTSELEALRERMRERMRQSPKPAPAPSDAPTSEADPVAQFAAFRERRRQQRKSGGPDPAPAPSDAPTSEADPVVQFAAFLERRRQQRKSGGDAGKHEPRSLDELDLAPPRPPACLSQPSAPVAAATPTVPHSSPLGAGRQAPHLRDHAVSAHASGSLSLRDHERHNATPVHAWGSLSLRDHERHTAAPVRHNATPVHVWGSLSLRDHERHTAALVQAPGSLSLRDHERHTAAPVQASGSLSLRHLSSDERPARGGEPERPALHVEVRMPPPPAAVLRDATMKPPRPESPAPPEAESPVPPRAPPVPDTIAAPPPFTAEIMRCLEAGADVFGSAGEPSPSAPSTPPRAVHAPPTPSSTHPRVAPEAAAPSAPPPAATPGTATRVLSPAQPSDLPVARASEPSAPAHKTTPELEMVLLAHQEQLALILHLAHEFQQSIAGAVERVLEEVVEAIRISVGEVSGSTRRLERSTGPKLADIREELQKVVKLLAHVWTPPQNQVDQVDKKAKVEQVDKKDQVEVDQRRPHRRTSVLDDLDDDDER